MDVGTLLSPILVVGRTYTYWFLVENSTWELGTISPTKDNPSRDYDGLLRSLVPY